jgi:cell division septation protein DedD
LSEGATARPAPRPAGASTAAVQIGAFATVALAEESWGDVKSLIPAQVRGKSRVIQPVNTNGSTLYRAMVVGFESYANAGRFCESLKAKGVDCFVKSDQPPKTG